jgi:hypothetical protein
MCNIRLCLIVSLVLSCTATANAKEWRGIIPLRSTKADVERIVGSPNSSGQYEIENDRVSVLYSDGLCANTNAQLAKNCECLVPKDTVLRIYLTFDLPPNISTLGLNKAKYLRTPFAAYEPSATYANFREGVVYTVRESDNRVTNVDYLPSARDCREIIERHANTLIKAWQGIVPWRSTRADVEKTLGRPTGSIGHVYIYRTATNRVDVAYSNNPCKIDYSRMSELSDIVLKITVRPHQRIIVRDLRLASDKYRRIKLDHPDNWSEYVNLEDGITVEAITIDRSEEVRSIVYEPPLKDRTARCGPLPKAAPTNP